MDGEDYSYVTAGFDGFLSRSIDDLTQVNLESQGPQSTAMRYDSAQVSGMLGDTLQMGNVHIDKQAIVLSDGTTDRLIIGYQAGGF